VPSANPPGYSGTPQARKLGLKPAQRVALDQPPAGWKLSELPPGIELVDYRRGLAGLDVIVSFFTAASELSRRLPALVESIYPDGAVWVAWPRRAGGHTSDITDGRVRDEALRLGVVDVKVAALDADWSALRFVWRAQSRSRRPARAPGAAEDS